MSFLKILRYELKKIFEQKSIWVIAIILLSVSMFNVYKSYYQKKTDENTGYITTAEAEKKMINHYSGELSPERINEFMSDYAESEQASVNDAVSEYNPDKYFCGFAYGDFQIMQEIKNEMERIYFYNDYVTEIRNEALELSSAFSSSNAYLSKYNEKMADVYSQRKVTHFYNTKDFPIYFEYKFTSFIVMILILLGLTTKFCGECETGMNQTILTCKYGRDKTSLAKLFSGFIYVISVSVMFSVIDFVVFKLCLGFSGLNQYLYAINEYANTTLNLKIWQALLLLFVVKTLGFLVFSGIIMLVSSVLNSSIKTYIVSALITVFLMLFTIIVPDGIGEYLNLLNPVRLINSQYLFKEFKAINLFGTPVFTIFVAVISGVLLLCIISVVTLLVSRKYKAGRRGK